MGVRGGRPRKAEAGGFAFGSLAFDYSKPERKGGDLRPDDAQQAALKRITELRDEGKSIRQIISTLHAEGHRPKRGDTWNPGTLSRIIRRMESSAA